ncbi:MAG: two-component system, NarL family, response regulator DevR [Solirubrobacteraceae bacterium]|jgi:DNA-binding NarL/FixJ family response regulator|nr:two-component system, NarL family, response regulator DevR [Solirubrobacteraceae bacterium]MEA2137474.1 two-component system, NarL family, response regulator DevR [Solirubrobacteraceae bacterium]
MLGSQDEARASGQESDAQPTQFRIVVATDRPAVGTFFASMSRRSSDSVATTIIDPALNEGARRARAVAEASVAVVDSSPHPREAREICAELRLQRPGLPLAILFCCPCSTTPPQLRSFISIGVASFIDLQLTPERALAVLRAVARGEDVVCLQLVGEAVTAIFEGRDESEQLGDEELRLLRLVAAGMTDNEIGGHMYLSPHTVKHRIERLRHRAKARNRIQLAAWAAGRYEIAVPGSRESS